MSPANRARWNTSSGAGVRGGPGVVRAAGALADGFSSTGLQGTRRARLPAERGAAALADARRRHWWVARLGAIGGGRLTKL
jgi:hypothetical protein